jgi:two-component system, LytTR family, response regulator
MNRAVIIDDEPAGISTLKLLIEKHAPFIRVVASTTKAEEGIHLIDDYKPEIVFLDISMPTMSGFQLLEKLEHRNFKLVFTTAHRDYALQAIKNNAFDYLLKPIDVADFKVCIEKLTETTAGPAQEAAKNNPSLIEVQVKDGIIYIKQKDIIKLEASGSYTVFHLTEGLKHIASRSLKEYEAFLDPAGFFRCHNSYIVNLHRVDKFINRDGFFAQMNDGSLVDISRKNKELFIEKLKNI